MCNLNTLHQQGSGCPFCEPLVLAILSLGCGVEERQAEAMRTLGSLSQSVVVSVRAGSELRGHPGWDGSGRRQRGDGSLSWYLAGSLKNRVFFRCSRTNSRSQT